MHGPTPVWGVPMIRVDLEAHAAARVGVGLEVEPHPGGKVWVVRTAPPLPA